MIAKRIDAIKVKIYIYERFKVRPRTKLGKSPGPYEKLRDRYSAMLPQVEFVLELLDERLNSAVDVALIDAHKTPRPICYHDEDYFSRYEVKRDVSDSK
jgi:hypothetical protein